MSRGFPSMTALLGMLAIAVYQNRDKLAEMLGGALPKGESGGAPGQQGGLGGLLEQSRAPASAAYSAAGLVSSSTALNRLAEGILPILGSGPAPTSRLRRLISSRRLGRM